MSSLPAEKAIYIVGAGGHGRELNSYLRDLHRAGWRGELRGFLDDAIAPGGYNGINVVGPVDALEDSDLAAQPGYITAFGDNHLRRKIVARLESLYGEKLTPWTLIHPSALVGCGSEIGEGTCLAAGSIVTAKTRIGRHAILNVKASVSHDCTVGDFANVNPGATICGWVSVGEGAYIGAGAVIKDRISIGPWSVVGAGAVVVRDVPAHTTVIGVPARILRHDSDACGIEKR